MIDLSSTFPSSKSRKRASATETSYLGLILAAWAAHRGPKWMINSLVLDVLGSASAFMFQGVYWLAGAAWGCITGSHAVRLRAEALLPRGVEPYRSAFGILIVFAIIGSVTWVALSKLRPSQELLDFVEMMLMTAFLFISLALV